MDSDDRYTVISADCHAGAELRDYKAYLETRYHDAFDDWADHYISPFGDLERPDADRNWNSDRRLKELEADGIVGEVIYPNTVPPFFPRGGLTALVPSAEEFELRLAGLRAHNRWLAEFCEAAPGRRAGVGQILLNDLDEAVQDVQWIADHDLRGGVLLPGVPPGAPIAPLHSRSYDPVWRVCEERGVVLNTHGGSASPDYGEHPGSQLLWLMETSWFSHRPFWTLVLSGVFDRFPGLRMGLAEQGSGWIPPALEAMDGHYASISGGGIGELRTLDGISLSQRPSDYWRNNCYVAASFMHPFDCARRDAVGADRIMWGSDYPHLEGTFPFSLEALQRTFADVEPEEAQTMLGRTAADVYRFDWEALSKVAQSCGPRVGDVAGGLEAVPEGARSLAFRERPPLNV